jgi:hypothetical protein
MCQQGVPKTHDRRFRALWNTGKEKDKTIEGECFLEFEL